MKRSSFFHISTIFIAHQCAAVLFGSVYSLSSQAGANYGLFNQWNQETSEVEKDVVNLLFTDYNKYTRPNEKETDVVVVSLELTVSSSNFHDRRHIETARSLRSDPIGL